MRNALLRRLFVASGIFLAASAGTVMLVAVPASSPDRAPAGDRRAAPVAGAAGFEGGATARLAWYAPVRIADHMRGFSEPAPLDDTTLALVLQHAVEPAQPAEGSGAAGETPVDEARNGAGKMPRGPRLQAGIFARVSNAEELRRQLETAGYPVYLEVRVLVGPYPSRREADLAREKLKADGTPAVFIAK